MCKYKQNCTYICVNKHKQQIQNKILINKQNEIKKKQIVYKIFVSVNGI